jgi:lysozyme
MLYGLDVSDVQGVVNWPKVAAAGYTFALIKCGNGNSEVDGRDCDERFDPNVTGARAAGLFVGAYNFCYVGLPSGPGLPADRSPEDQAQRHWECSGGLGSIAGDLVTMADFEWPEQAEWAKYGITLAGCQDWMRRYLTKYDALSGRMTGIYTDRWWWLDVVHGDELEELAARPFWAAQPVITRPINGSAPRPWAPWTTWQIWQWSQSSIIPGIVDKVDLDVIADDATLARLTGQSS